AGARGHPFTLHKFRTMREPAGADGQTDTPAARLTRFGRWLRSTSLDELPELWDVLRGRMSLVGPRPLLMDYLPLYSPEQARRHSMRPGMTGWAQVHGRNGITWEEKLALDVWYVEHASPLIDLRILLQTLPQVFTHKNISPSNGLIMERFHGRQA
ncbi:MAG TPA: sugar transferase, partial [Longimicrobiales bacterium]